MINQKWTLNDIHWDSFSPQKLDANIVPIIKAAALVEYNAHDYATYLKNVFKNDTVFQEKITKWSEEEIRHGEALGRWAERADPSFNFKQSFDRFKEGYRIAMDVDGSIRGSQVSELIARCIVEIGTSSYYSALADATEEPVLKSICRAIAGDEFKHYSMFYNALMDCMNKQSISVLARLRVGLSRILESEDDELAYAFYAANAREGVEYTRAIYRDAYAARAYRFYQPHHVKRVVAMVFKTCGLPPGTFWHGVAQRAAWWMVQARTKRAIARAA